MTGNEVLHAGKPRGSDDLLVGRVRLAERDVVADLAEEQVGVLQHEADAGAQIGRIVLAHIDAVDDDLAVRGLVEAGTRRPTVVLPDPTRPMMPTRSPPAILNETFSSAASLEPGYLKMTFSKAMLPFSMRRAT